ncbi:MAG: hypothetical protein ACOYWZ_07165 [Bacillota bacterium]
MLAGHPARIESSGAKHRQGSVSPILRRHFISLALIIIALTSIVPIIAFLGQDYSVFTFCFVIEIFIILIFVFVTLFRSIYIGPIGVRYKSPFKCYEIKWQDIKEIGVGEIRNSKSVASFIYFSKDKVHPSALDLHKISDRFIMIVFKPKVIKEVRKYWKYRIDGLSGTKLDDANNTIPPNNEKL